MYIIHKNKKMDKQIDENAQKELTKLSNSNKIISKGGMKR